MKNTLKLSAIALALLGAGSVYAANHSGSHNHDHGGAKEAQVTVAAAEMADGEIRKINKTTGKVTLKHGDIKSVGMPPMTMVFGVADKGMLEGLKEGDKVKFDVKQEGSNYTVTEIKKAQ
ncbi:MAG: copper-binding protein [Gammaproteobacteria bacterium]|uniref:copper-binding protein n=1 Tax=Limnobacter sp. TaxID=2003368 RepID=UPI001D99AC01|nr:copper-binding protein [Limnobacter sp.]MBU0784102.1 copper-binding protein [Gammaproteobacteria bacterium]MBU0849840.1 copper-binding protein [Gammaproteobacteria bacterium]MBU1266874.1 copper-binding protein [Gammaproteobacteria bacterium]MBU1528710.1 copper-binding protein [Gammaproteobacteria bacterium]MBU1779714.1 copper-binding protein [Gammaproteobacteria bacterium]